MVDTQSTNMQTNEKQPNPDDSKGINQWPHQPFIRDYQLDSDFEDQGNGIFDITDHINYFRGQKGGAIVGKDSNKVYGTFLAADENEQCLCATMNQPLIDWINSLE